MSIQYLNVYFPSNLLERYLSNFAKIRKMNKSDYSHLNFNYCFVTTPLHIVTNLKKKKKHIILICYKY